MNFTRQSSAVKAAKHLGSSLAAFAALILGMVALPSMANAASEQLHAEIVSVSPTSDIGVGTELVVESYVENRGASPAGESLAFGISDMTSDPVRQSSVIVASTYESVTASPADAGTVHWRDGGYSLYLERDLQPGERVTVTRTMTAVGKDSAESSAHQNPETFAGAAGRLGLTMSGAEGVQRNCWYGDSPTSGLGSVSLSGNGYQTNPISGDSSCFFDFETVARQSGYNVTITSEPVEGGTLLPNGQVRYLVTLTNSSAATLTPVGATSMAVTPTFGEVTDVKASQGMVNSFSGEGGSDIVWDTEAVKPGATITLSFTVGAAVEAPGDEITATVSSMSHLNGTDISVQSNCPVEYIPLRFSLSDEPLQAGSEACVNVLAVSEPVVYVTPLPPTLVPGETCDIEGSVDIPTMDGVTYSQTRSGDTITVTAVTDAGMEISEGAAHKWTFNVSAVPCAEPDATKVKATSPTLAASDTCDVESSVSIPSTPGVAYEESRAGDTVTVRASAANGYQMDPESEVEWSFVVTPKASCDPQASTPDAVNTAQPTESVPELARTGTSMKAAAGFGVAIIAAGLLLSMISRRRSA
ncbi:hypothetical protein EDF62_1603 [Leucobacter luti]|uniref:Repeat protein (TIGR01451 family) n=1 Tax=Leucobacter luti TaxID=340320 RepID=A0A4R6S187_9MICO|nr:hypothetical protein [Leucobacter luti]TDP92396.1 hypothetical protein EDF62_1603 [Leucobacter luti]